jgi:hypothetical protein
LFGGDDGRARIASIENLIAKLPGMNAQVATSVARRLQP